MKIRLFLVFGVFSRMEGCRLDSGRIREVQLKRVLLGASGCGEAAYTAQSTQRLHDSLISSNKLFQMLIPIDATLLAEIGSMTNVQ